jgi:GTP cyclohydrolase II
MRINNIKNPKAFFETLNKCKGKVELCTEEGDRLNMKSKLCQYIAMTDIFSDAEIGEIEIMVSEPEDVMHLVEFMIKG